MIQVRAAQTAQAVDRLGQKSIRSSNMSQETFLASIPKVVKLAKLKIVSKIIVIAMWK